MANEASSAELAIIMSYIQQKRVEQLFYEKHPQNIENSSRPFLEKTTDFQFVFNFEQTRTETIIWRAWYKGQYTMMAKPIRALGFHYPII